MSMHYSAEYVARLNVFEIIVYLFRFSGEQDIIEVLVCDNL